MTMQRFVQLALDLFDAPPAPSAGPSGAQPKPPDAQQTPAHAASKTMANQSAGLHALLAPVQFRHPQASREVRLGGAVIGYALQRARRSSIGFSVGPDGLSVRAPRWVTLAAVDSALQEKADWILRKLGEARERQRRCADARIVWADGALLPYLGAPLQIRLAPGHDFAAKGAALLAASASDTTAAAAAAGAPPSLLIALPHSASAGQIRDAVQAWLMRDARRHFSARLDHFAPLLGVRWTSLRLSSAQTRWGSARHDGSIRLNWRLLHHRPAVIDYVVAHELAHLRVMDHSASFWNTVATVVPDHARLRRNLRDEPVPPWD